MDQAPGSLPPPPPQQPQNPPSQPPPYGYPGYSGPPPAGFPPAPGYFPGMPFYPPPIAEKLSEKEKLNKNNTLYIKNLNAKIKPDYLKLSLQNVFTQYGTILEIHLKRNFRMRGQAFIVFETEEAAENALKAMDGAFFYQKPLMINYARKKSDIITKRGGEIDEEEKKKREENNKKFKEWIEYIRNLRVQEKLNKLKNEQNELMSQSHKKRADTHGYGDGDQPGQSAQGPSGVLNVRNLPQYTNQLSLHGIFSHYPGFAELRLSPASDSATVHYNSQAEASAAYMGKCNYLH